MTDDLTGVQRAVLSRLADSDPATVTEAHQWWFRHLSRERVKAAVGWLETLGLVRTAGIGPRNAPTYTATDKGRATLPTVDTTEETR